MRNIVIIIIYDIGDNLHFSCKDIVTQSSSVACLRGGAESCSGRVAPGSVH